MNLALLDNLEKFIYLRNGTTIFDKRFERCFSEAEFLELLSCVEDNIFTEDGEEKIDYAAVRRVFPKASELEAMK